MSHRKFTDEQEADIGRLYEAGSSYPQLAQQFGTSMTTIKHAVRRQGIMPRRCGRSALEVKAEILQYIAHHYPTGASQVSIAETLGVNQTLISRGVRQLGLQRPFRRNRDGHGRWKGGRVKTTAGYISLWIDANHPFACMAGSTGYVLEHRLVMAEFLGRPLRPDETVHHLNGAKGDNRLENLQVLNGRHGKGVRLCCMDCGSHRIGVDALVPTRP